MRIVRLNGIKHLRKFKISYWKRLIKLLKHVFQITWGKMKTTIMKNKIQMLKMKTNHQEYLEWAFSQILKRWKDIYLPRRMIRETNKVHQIKKISRNLMIINKQLQFLRLLMLNTPKRFKTLKIYLIIKEQVKLTLKQWKS